MTEKITFSFGRNWYDFLRSLNKDRFEFAEKSLTDFLEVKDLKGKSFIDIGCGSGLFSYTAQKLGSESVISFDLDPFSIKCCKHMKKLAENPKKWQILEGSILDDKFTSNLGKSDIVYSWGVLHHTGEMWKAVHNSASLVKKGGYYYIAIYNKIGGVFGSKTWLKIKKFYNSSSKFRKYILELSYVMLYLSSYTMRMKNPVKHVREYHKTKRGMRFKIDVIDWLGGYPYEYATVNEIKSFLLTNFPDFKFVKSKNVKGLGNNWFLFKREGTA